MLAPAAFGPVTLRVVVRVSVARCRQLRHCVHPRHHASVWERRSRGPHVGVTRTARRRERYTVNASQRAPVKTSLGLNFALYSSERHPLT